MNKMRKLPQQFVIGIKTRTSNETFQKEGYSLWGRFQNEGIFEKIPHRLNNEIIAVYTEYAGDHTKPYTFLIGCEVSSLKEIPEGMTSLLISQGNYAVFSTKGPFPQSVVKSWQNIWASDVKRAYEADFEIYPKDFDRSRISEIPIYISLKP